MARFACISPHAHETLPRRIGHRPSLHGSAQPYNGLPADVGVGPQVNASAMPSLNTPLGRNMSRRKGAKLQKRAKVRKSIIGQPKDFMHVSHVNRAEALQSKELAEVFKVLQESDPSLQQEEGESRSFREEPTSSPDTQHEPVPLTHDRKPTVNRRKAPPPVTPSIIRAAGLPAHMETRQPVPAVPAALSPLLGLYTSTSASQARPATEDRAETDATLHGVRQPEPQPDSISGLPAIPDTLEAMLSSSKHTNEDEGLTRVSQDAKTPSNGPFASTSDERIGAHPPKKQSPLDYMTDTTKVKWNNGMAEIAKQLREGDFDEA